MATYKVPQDVEADDKFLGPLSFKQFIFGGIVAVVGYLAFFLGILKGFWPIFVIALPIIIVCGFLAFPWGRDQPTEVWLAAKIRFFLKPRKRVWDQSGLKELVTVTAPKKIEKIFSDNLSQDEVKSRLSALSTMLDSRGWAVKNVNVNLYSGPTAALESVDRLVDTSALPQEIQNVDVGAADDMMDPTSNSSAHHIDELVQQSRVAKRAEIDATLAAVRNPTKPDGHEKKHEKQKENPDFWFMNQDNGSAKAPPAGYTNFSSPSVVRPGQSTSGAPTSSQTLTADDQALLEHVHEEKEKAKHIKQFGKLKTLQPIDRTKKHPNKEKAKQTANDKPVTAPVDPAILNLASRDDLNVATLAREAADITDNKNGEVVIRLQH